LAGAARRGVISFKLTSKAQTDTFALPRRELVENVRIERFWVRFVQIGDRKLDCKYEVGFKV
jgi:hypothetical protein